MKPALFTLIVILLFSSCGGEEQPAVEEKPAPTKEFLTGNWYDYDGTEQLYSFNADGEFWTGPAAELQPYNYAWYDGTWQADPEWKNKSDGSLIMESKNKDGYRNGCGVIIIDNDNIVLHGLNRYDFPNAPPATDSPAERSPLARFY